MRDVSHGSRMGGGREPFRRQNPIIAFGQIRNQEARVYLQGPASASWGLHCHTTNCQSRTAKLVPRESDAMQTAAPQTQPRLQTCTWRNDAAGAHRRHNTMVILSDCGQNDVTRVTQWYTVQVCMHGALPHTHMCPGVRMCLFSFLNGLLLLKCRPALAISSASTVCCIDVPLVTVHPELSRLSIDVPWCNEG